MLEMIDAFVGDLPGVRQRSSGQDPAAVWPAP
jgi:hypothetical protein